MKVVILNWKAGSNDPFSFVNLSLKHYFLACGKDVEILEITDSNWPTRLIGLLSEGVEFAYTWQGLGSGQKLGSQNESIWSLLKIPLICVHGDHPAHMPVNHQLESRYCFHLYTNASFARYSNQHFRRVRGASTLDFPQLFYEPRRKELTGDYFVVAKNITDTNETEAIWRKGLSKPAFDAYMMAAETLKSLITSEYYVETHDVLDELIANNDIDWLKPEVNLAEFHQYHSQLDYYVRNFKSIAALASVREFPVRIYGRGWDRIEKHSAPSHSFMPGRNMADSQDFYYSKFGLIDISPAKELHDRTRRAIDNQCAFLSSANLEDSFPDIGRFDSLFFSFKGGELSEKCEAILRDPEGHLNMAQQFSRRYHDRFHFKDWVNRIDLLAKSVTFL